MARAKPSESPKEVEQRLVSKAYKAVEKRIDRGEATAAELVHFLKIGAEAHSLDAEKLRLETELLSAKIEAVNSASKLEELYTAAIAAMRNYSGEHSGAEL